MAETAAETSEVNADKAAELALANAEKKRGAAIYEERGCVGCHGDTGVSTDIDPTIPNLTGQSRVYVLGALTAYRDLTRQSDYAKFMQDQTADLTDDDISALSSYLASLGAPTPSDLTSEAGKALYKEEGCWLCHGTHGKANHKDWPNIGGQNAEYIVIALTSYREHKRKYPNSAMMENLMDDFDDEQIAHVAIYLSSLQQDEVTE